jgi:hypothetical protein
MNGLFIAFSFVAAGELSVAVVPAAVEVGKGRAAYGMTAAAGGGGACLAAVGGKPEYTVYRINSSKRARK